MDQLELTTTTTLFIVAIIFILIGTNKYHKRLEKVISIQDNTIIALHKELAEYQKLYHIKQLEITRVAAENAVLKQRVIELEDKPRSFNEPKIQYSVDERIDNIRKNITKSKPKKK